MDLPITLTEFGIALGGIVVGAFSRISYWILLESFEQRKQRREWYSDLASIANRLNNTYDSNQGLSLIDNNVYYISRDSANELKEIENELNSIINKPVNVGFSAGKSANALYDALTDLNNHLDIQKAESDNEAYIFPMDVNESSVYNEINEVIDRVAERSLEVHDKATQKARSGTTIPILRVRV